MIFRRTRLVYGLLVLALGLVVAWQVVEHDRVKQVARTAVINRSRDITTTLGLVIRSQRRWSVVSQERLESALTELVKAGGLNSVSLLNASGEVVASAGASPIDFETKGMMQSGERWEHKSVTIVNLVDLGASVASEGETNRPTIVLPRRESAGGPREEERPPPPLRGEGRTNYTAASRGTNSAPNNSNSASNPGSASNALSNEFASGTQPERRPGRPRFGRPPWMDEREYRSLVERRGLHGIVMVLSTEAFRRTCSQDLWMRWIIAGFAGISVLGLGLAWRNLTTSSELQMRLLRASELNSHLKGMNLAAAGLAHETRNPLNIIRGLAQMISKQPDASADIRNRTREIIDETDRVSAQLNEFINYSRPREVRRSAVPLGSVIAEVVRALNYDIEEKNIRLQVAEEQLTVEADEQLLRQALFNLLLNAIQAVASNGEIQIIANKQTAAEAFIEVRDNGPGVPLEHRADIFKPYFTTQQKGTGLGLAVVQQIILAHGWDIECLSNEPRGAVFRISHLKPVAQAPK